MNIRRVLTLVSVVLLTAALAAPALAGGRNRNGAGVAQGDTDRTQVRAQDRLRDGSCLLSGAATQGGAQTQMQTQSQSQTRERTQSRERLRDRSRLTTPASAGQ